MAAAMRRFSSSLRFDRRLVLFDLEVSRAHAGALARAGLIPEAELAAPEDALARIAGEARAGTFPAPAAPEHEPEDIHSAIEARLVELCGDAARRLHAGRSRNDQVATSVLLWLRGATGELLAALDGLIEALVAQAER